MREKIPSEIIQLALSDASYEGCGVSITPTLINFFFGNNGTGKSTVARTIKAGAGVTWKEGKQQQIMSFMSITKNISTPIFKITISYPVCLL